MRRMWMGICSTILALMLTSAPMPAMSVPDPGEAGPFAVASLDVTITNPATGDALATTIFFPAAGDRVDPTGAPHEAVLFAHGFMATTTNYSGNAEHLASWGYIVAVPDLPVDQTEPRQSDARYVLTYLEQANGDASSPLYGMVNTAGFGVTGHSLGGLTAMIAVARDARVRAAVALDPVNPPPESTGIIDADPWDYAAEAPNTTQPLLVLGGPAQTCNSEANYGPMFDAVGAAHRVELVVTDASHCDFMDPDMELISFVCGLLCGSVDATRTVLTERYSTAWFNYYLRGEAGYYRYLYGEDAAADVSAGRIAERKAYTSTRNPSALAEVGGVRVRWSPSDYAPIAGYNVYRTTQSGVYGTQPYAQVGRQGDYLDGGATPGQRYYYVVRSRDADGNEHGQSAEVSAMRAPGVTPTATSEPPMTPTTTPAPPTTPTATPEPGATPTVTPGLPAAKTRAYLPDVRQ